MNLESAASETKKILLDRVPLEWEGDPGCDISNLLFICEQIQSGAVTGDKAHRWLGWAQGVICCRKGASLEDFKDINRRAQ